TLNISSSGERSIIFGAPAGSTVSSFAIQGPSYATVGDSASDGAQVWVSAVDSTGRIVTNYYGSITINVSGSALLYKNSTQISGTYYFTSTDNGEVLFTLVDSQPESVTMTINSDAQHSYHVNFAGLGKFYIVPGVDFVTVGKRIKFIAYAQTAGGQKINYNGLANWKRISETTDNSSSYISPAQIQFHDGMAEFYVEDSEYESVAFRLEEGAIISNDVTATFQNVNQTPPVVTQVVGDTPYIVHIYFDKDVDSTNALREDNYNGVGQINKVCWYGDDVTLHLAQRLDLGSNQTLTVKGFSSNGSNAIKDKDGNYIQNDVNMSFSVPLVDYQGSPNPGQDWFEVQVTQQTVPVNVDTVVGVKVFHKNACGYLTGSNRVNATTQVSSANISYSGSGTVVNGPSSVDVSSGEAQFTVTVNCNSGQSVQIAVTSGSVSSSVNPTITGQ
ncbi:MAG: hypothetical protein V1692_02110, partial [bacterium]